MLAIHSSITHSFIPSPEGNFFLDLICGDQREIFLCISSCSVDFLAQPHNLKLKT
jgi:hypothetical protein